MYYNQMLIIKDQMVIFKAAGKGKHYMTFNRKVYN